MPHFQKCHSKNTQIVDVWMKKQYNVISLFAYFNDFWSNLQNLNDSCDLFSVCWLVLFPHSLPFYFAILCLKKAAKYNLAQKCICKPMERILSNPICLCVILDL